MIVFRLLDIQIRVATVAGDLFKLNSCVRISLSPKYIWRENRFALAKIMATRAIIFLQIS